MNQDKLLKSKIQWLLILKILMSDNDNIAEIIDELLTEYSEELMTRGVT